MKEILKSKDFWVGLAFGSLATLTILGIFTLIEVAMGIIK